MSNPTNLDTLELNPKCLLTELEDGTGVVLNLETKFYHTLNSTAVIMWKALERGAQAPRQLADQLVRAFQVDEELAVADVGAGLRDFEREGFLLRRSERSRLRGED